MRIICLVWLIHPCIRMQRGQGRCDVMGSGGEDRGSRQGQERTGGNNCHRILHPTTPFKWIGEILMKERERIPFHLTEWICAVHKNAVLIYYKHQPLLATAAAASAKLINRIEA